MGPARLPALLALPLLALLLPACTVPSGQLALGEAEAEGWSDPTAQDLPDDGSDEPQGLIEGPSEVVVFAGDEVAFDLTLATPGLGRIEAGLLPEASIFESYDSLATFRWAPEMADVGQYDLVFLVVDLEEPDLVLAQTSVILSVLPVSSLVEYGF